MNLYYVATPAAMGWMNLLRTVRDNSGIDPFPANILMTFFDFWNRKKKKSMDDFLGNLIDPSEIRLFLDSGAYGASTHNVIIDVNEYAQFIKDNEHWLNVYANLDVKHSWQLTADNQKALEDAGLTPLPVFHGGEPDKVKQDLIDNYEYICIGGIVGGKSSSIDLLPALKEFSKEVLRKKKRTHLFGVGSFEVLRQAYFYSSDLTSFSAAPRYGFFPIFDEARMKIVHVKYRSAAAIKYEHLISRYGLETYSFSIKKPRGYLGQVNRALQYMSLFRMSQWLNAMWKQKGYN